jgi:hypothetical protein
MHRRKQNKRRLAGGRNYERRDDHRNAVESRR